MKDQTQEEDDDYNIYYASNPKEHTSPKGKGKQTHNTEHSGTAIVISKIVESRAIIIDPRSSRLITATLQATTSIKIKVISCYATQADQQYSLKYKFYDQLSKIETEEITYRQYWGGDSNALPHGKDIAEDNVGTQIVGKEQIT